MKKSLILLLSLVLMMSSLTACGGNKKNNESANANATENNAEGKETSEKKVIDVLKVQFVPSRDPESIVTATAPLEETLKEELANFGYDVKKVDVSVGTSYEATGEALAAGTVDVGFIPGGTYVLYDDGCDVLLTATRDGLNVDADDPKEWNANKPSHFVEEPVTFYRSIIVAGPSAKGQELSKKVEAGEELTWEDISSAKWSIRSSSSSAGYIYPYLWIQKNYDKKLTDIPTTVQADSYPSSIARLASEQVDLAVFYADARIDYEKQWTEEFGRKASIWDETNVIGVTGKIYNDTISVSKNSKIMDDDFKAALADSFINIGKSEKGKAIIAVYNHTGYQKADSADYDSEREAQNLLKEFKNQ